MGGSVWSAWQSSTRRRVAVKILPPTGSVPAERFARGARIASNLNHPNITTVHDYGQTSAGDLYLVMELLEGRDLFQVSRREDVDFPRLVHVFSQVLRALGHAHQRNVVHRDVKLSNLFLTPTEDDPDFVKVLDFGIARYIVGGGASGDEPQDEVTGVHQLCGTPQYMAPEQIGFGTIGAQADLYAIGVSVFRLLTGEFPFKGTSHELFRQHLQSAPPSISDKVSPGTVPEGLDDWLMMAMAKKPEDRFVDAAHMRKALFQLHDGAPPSSVVTQEPISPKALGHEEPPETESTPRAAAMGPESSVVVSRPHLQKQPLRRMITALATVSLFGLLTVFFLVDLRESDESSTQEISQVQESDIQDPKVKVENTGPDATVVGRTRPEPAPPKAKKSVRRAAPKKVSPVSRPVPTAAPNAREASDRRQWVRIQSIPRGAQVTWNTKRIGQTPLSVPLPLGSHTFQLQRSGFISVKKTIDIDTIVEEEHQYSWNLQRRFRRAKKGKRKDAKKRIPEATTPASPKEQPDTSVPPKIVEAPKPLRVHILGDDDLERASESTDRQRPRVQILE